MFKTLVLFLHLANGQVVTIPGFQDRGDCEATGQWYKQAANATIGNKVDYWCGPGPSVDMGR